MYVQNKSIFIYQAIISSPNNIARKVPTIKNGAKGTSLFRPFFPNIINSNPIIAPNKNAKNNPAKMLGNPKINPNKIANFTSPNPIHLPEEIRNINKKNSAAPMPAKI